MTGRVVAFPTLRSCADCLHYDMPPMRCRLFDTEVDSETEAAKDCDGFSHAAPPRPW